MAEPTPSKRDTLIALLLRYEEALGGTKNPEGDNTGTPHLPSTWNHTYVELARCLTNLNHDDPTAHMHLKARYCTSHRRQLRDVRLRHGRLQHRTGIPKRWHTLPTDHTQIVVGTPRSDIGVDVIVLEWRQWVNGRHVQRGLDYLEQHFVGEPMLPHEFVCQRADCDRCSGRLRQIA